MNKKWILASPMGKHFLQRAMMVWASYRHGRRDLVQYILEKNPYRLKNTDYGRYLGEQKTIVNLTVR